MHEVNKDLGPDREPKAQVALTAKQWSAVVMAVSHGVEVIKSAKTIPIVAMNRFLVDIMKATQEIQRKLEVKPSRQGERRGE